MGDGRGSAWLWVRIALVVFVLAWILGPSELRDSVPILVVFLIALGLEVNFLVGALRGGPTRQPDRRPQEIDRQRYGFEAELEDDLDDDWPEPEPRSAAIRRFALGLGVIARARRRRLVRRREDGLELDRRGSTGRRRRTLLRLKPHASRRSPSRFVATRRVTTSGRCSTPTAWRSSAESSRS